MISKCVIDFENKLNSDTQREALRNEEKDSVSAPSEDALAITSDIEEYNPGCWDAVKNIFWPNPKQKEKYVLQQLINFDFYKDFRRIEKSIKGWQKIKNLRTKMLFIQSPKKGLDRRDSVPSIVHIDRSK